MVAVGGRSCRFTGSRFGGPHILHSGKVNMGLNNCTFSTSVEHRGERDLKLGDNSFTIFYISRLAREGGLLFTLGIVGKLMGRDQGIMGFFMENGNPLRSGLRGCVSSGSLNRGIHLVNCNGSVRRVSYTTSTFLLASLRRKLPITILRTVDYNLPYIISSVENDDSLFTFNNRKVTYDLGSRRSFIRTLNSVVGGGGSFSHTRTIEGGVRILRSCSVRDIRSFLGRAISTRVTNM